MKNDCLDKYNDLIYSIIKTEKYKAMKNYYAHKNVSCYEHSIRVCKSSLFFVDRYNIKCNTESLIKGALLHDYYLYDWHNNKSFTFHGLKHHEISLKNAERDYIINKKVKNIIYSHMFPLTFWTIPLCKEALIVSTFDKVEAVKDLKNNF